MDVRTSFFVLLLLFLGAIATLMVAPLVQYVLAACLLAFVLRPLQERLAPALGSRVSALALTGVAVVAGVVPLVVVSVIVLQTILSFLDGFDESAAIESIREFARELGVEDETLDTIETQLVSELEGVLTNAVEFVLFELIGVVNTTLEIAIGLMVLVFLLYYLLLDGSTFVAWLGDVLPIADAVHERLITEVESVTWAVIYTHILVALIEGILGGLGLWLLGVPNVAFWTVVMVVVSFLPAIGVWLVWGPAVTYLAFVGEPLSAVALFLYGIAVLSVVDNYLRAIFVDHGTGLHPAVVLIGVIGGLYLLGFLGLFLGPILLAVLKAGLDVFGDVYGDEPLPTPAAGTTPASIDEESEKPD